MEKDVLTKYVCWKDQVKILRNSQTQSLDTYVTYTLLLSPLEFILRTYVVRAHHFLQQQKSCNWNRVFFYKHLFMSELKNEAI